MVLAKTFKDLKPFLMDPGQKGIDNPFYQILSNGQAIFVISSGLNSTEFNKTTVFLNNYEGLQVYQCLYGQGLILMQRMDEIGEAKEFKVVSLSPGRQVTIPANWAVCMVNVGKSFLVVLGNVNESDKLEPKAILEKQGLAYYVVEKKGDISFEQNPKYRVHPQISTE